MTPKGRKGVAKRRWRQQKRGGADSTAAGGPPRFGRQRIGRLWLLPAELVAATDTGGGGRKRSHVGGDLDPPKAWIDGGRGGRDGAGCAGVRRPAPRDRRSCHGPLDESLNPFCRARAAGRIRGAGGGDHRHGECGGNTAAASSGGCGWREACPLRCSWRSRFAL